MSPLYVRRIGKALIEKSTGDEISVKTPGGTREFEVADICVVGKK
jgi:transcription elongation GreA/GreB family factor